MHVYFGLLPPSQERQSPWSGMNEDNSLVSIQFMQTCLPTTQEQRTVVPMDGLKGGSDHGALCIRWNLE